ncbi:unnamed protein product [Gongylonema pulchrum]|uniref:Uncharacterized protein n=1 Tax=Gongylonema pulchrum TaxID=637853 RepID=A0A183DKC5_9BILA|nr:unnamed protein product [Gongylonema pulchrum]
MNHAIHTTMFFFPTLCVSLVVTVIIKRHLQNGKRLLSWIVYDETTRIHRLNAYSSGHKGRAVGFFPVTSQKARQRKLKEAEKEEMERRIKEREMRSYDGVFNEEKMHSNYDDGNDSDDFM